MLFVHLFAITCLEFDELALKGIMIVLRGDILRIFYIFMKNAESMGVYFRLEVIYFDRFIPHYESQFASVLYIRVNS